MYHEVGQRGTSKFSICTWKDGRPLCSLPVLIHATPGFSGSQLTYVHFFTWYLPSSWDDRRWASKIHFFICSVSFYRGLVYATPYLRCHRYFREQIKQAPGPVESILWCDSARAKGTRGQTILRMAAHLRPALGFSDSWLHCDWEPPGSDLSTNVTYHYCIFIFRHNAIIHNEADQAAEYLPTLCLKCSVKSLMSFWYSFLCRQFVFPLFFFSSICLYPCCS